MLTETLGLSAEALAAFCRRWHVVELAVFGSAVRGELRPDSDVDVLVTFDPKTQPGLFDVARMQEELEELVGREVDVMTRQAVEQSPNEIRRRAILESARPLFHAEPA